MVLKVIVIALLIVILYCLGSGMYYLVRPGNFNTQVVRALTWRISLSILLFVLLLVSHWMGWITPHPIAESVTATPYP